MSNNSIIEHRANYYFIELREEYLHICQECSYKKSKSKASPHCKAFILAIMESWTNDKRGKGEELSVYMTYPQWIESMYGMFGRCVIIDSLEELLGEGLLSREKYRMYGKDTYKYLLNHQELNRRIKDLPERDPKHTRPKIDASTNRRDNSEDASTNRCDTRLLVDAYPSKSRRNIESTKILNIESKEGKNADDSTKSEDLLSSTPSPSLIANPATENLESTATRNISSGPITEPLKPQPPDPEAVRVFGLLCERFFAIPPEFTSRIEKQCAQLAPHLRNAEDLNSLRDYTRAKILNDPSLPDKQAHLGNLIKCVNGWKQEQSPPPEKPDKKPRSSVVDPIAKMRAIGAQFIQGVN